MKWKRSIALLALAFTLALFPAVTALAKKPVRCDLYIEILDWTPPVYWQGSVTGDINGDLEIHPSKAWFPGSTEHFIETWTIFTDEGPKIHGFNEGVWNFKTGRWRTSGKVTHVDDDPTGLYTDLIGRGVFVRGQTTEFNPPDPIWSIWGTLRIS